MADRDVNLAVLTRTRHPDGSLTSWGRLVARDALPPLAKKLCAGCEAVNFKPAELGGGAQPSWGSLHDPSHAFLKLTVPAQAPAEGEPTTQAPEGESAGA